HNGWLHGIGRSARHLGPAPAGAHSYKPVALSVTCGAARTISFHVHHGVEMEVRMRSDADLLRSADSRAFRELYNRHAERIYRFQLARTRDRDAALELTAEAFAQAWLSRTRFRALADGSAAPWLYGIARHV